MILESPITNEYGNLPDYLAAICILYHVVRISELQLGAFRNKRVHGSADVLLEYANLATRYSYYMIYIIQGRRT